MTPLLKTLTGVADFFTTDDCRDLLFHVQERRATLPGDKVALMANDLEFVGFALDTLDPAKRFAARFPEPAALTDLDCWHAFESEMPQTFAGACINLGYGSGRRSQADGLAISAHIAPLPRMKAASENNL